MIIYGAGMAGLLAANVLRRKNPVVCEAAKELPLNHKALLRFRSDACSRATGIPFRKVRVQKAVVYDDQLLERGTLALNNMYSQKVTGSVLDRSILNTDTCDRYVAPDDFTSQLGAQLNIAYKTPLGPEVLRRDEHSEPAISTLPMPVLMKLVNWTPVPEFAWKPVWVINAWLRSCDVYQTLYYPGLEPYYRASITKDQVIIECISRPDENVEDLVFRVLRNFGIDGDSIDCSKPATIKEQKYGKITPLANGEGRRFITYMTDRYRVYSLGRFATWRNILLDEVAHDIQVIERIIDCREGYYKTLVEVNQSH